MAIELRAADRNTTARLGQLHSLSRCHRQTLHGPTEPHLRCSKPSTGAVRLWGLARPLERPPGVGECRWDGVATRGGTSCEQRIRGDAGSGRDDGSLVAGVVAGGHGDVETLEALRHGAWGRRAQARVARCCLWWRRCWWAGIDDVQRLRSGSAAAVLPFAVVARRLRRAVAFGHQLDKAGVCGRRARRRGDDVDLARCVRCAATSTAAYGKVLGHPLVAVRSDTGEGDSRMRSGSSQLRS